MKNNNNNKKKSQRINFNKYYSKLNQFVSKISQQKRHNLPSGYHKTTYFFDDQVKAVMYGCESWTIKRAQLRAKCQRLDVFELWCWRRFLRVPWTTRRSNQSILKDTSPEYSLEGLMPKMKLQYFGHLMWRTDSLEETLMLGKIEGRRRRGMTEDEMVEWHHRLNGHEFE